MNGSLPSRRVVAHAPVRVTARAEKGRNSGLDVVRAVAALGVLVTHVGFVSGVTSFERWPSQFRLLIPRLDVGVSIFFVLSGFLVGRPFVKDLLANRVRESRLGSYWWRRLLRILPLYWFVLAVTLATSGDPLPGPRALAQYVTLTHIYTPSLAIGPITQSWSLATELSFYALVPVWFWACRLVAERRRLLTAESRSRMLWYGLAGWVAVAFLWRLGVLATTSRYDRSIVGSVDTRGALLVWLPNYLDAFAIGIGCALAREQPLGSGGSRRWARLMRTPLHRPAMAFLSYLIGAVSLWVVGTRLGLGTNFTGFDGPQTLWRHWLFLITAGAAVLPSALGWHSRPVDVSVTTPAASSAASSVAGRPRGSLFGIAAQTAALGSYGIYLWHQFFADLWFDGTERPHFNSPFPTGLAVVLLGSVAATAVTYWLVERWPPRLGAWFLAAVPANEPVRLGTVAELEGLRGLAVSAVLGTHLIFLNPDGPRWILRGGYLGVDVFLVLSGFLICSTLFAERDRRGSTDLGSFVQRRVRRLLPAMTAFFAVHIVAVLLAQDSLREEAFQVLASLSFTTNWQLSFGHHPPFDLVHLWSLAAEGQLYLLCALGTILGASLLKTPKVAMSWCIALAGAVALWRLGWFARGTNPEALYERTDLRADSMLIGAIAALCWRSQLISAQALRRAAPVAAGALFLACWVARPAEPALFLGGFTLIGAASAICVLGAMVPGPLQRVLASRVLCWLGTISYSLYLWHLPIYVWLNRFAPSMSPWLLAPLAIGSSLGIAQLSYQVIERRFIQRGSSGGSSPRDPSEPVAA